MMNDISVSNEEFDQDIIDSLKPIKSKHRYEKEYKNFMAWCEQNHVKSMTDEDALLGYFETLKQLKKEATTLWPHYSMLKSCLAIKKSIDISKFTKLKAFLKRSFESYKRKKPKLLEDTDINSFIIKADDYNYLLIKVILIIRYSGGCLFKEMRSITVDDIQFKSSWIQVKINTIRSHKPRSIVITEQLWVDLIEKYYKLRPLNTSHRNFFVTYQKGKCSSSLLNIKKFSEIPKRIAAFLKLPTPELYNGHCFPKSSFSHMSAVSKVINLDMPVKPQLNTTFRNVPIIKECNSPILVNNNDTNENDSADEEISLENGQNITNSSENFFEEYDEMEDTKPFQFEHIEMKEDFCRNEQNNVTTNNEVVNIKKSNSPIFDNIDDSTNQNYSEESELPISSPAENSASIHEEFEIEDCKAFQCTILKNSGAQCGEGENEIPGPQTVKYYEERIRFLEDIIKKLQNENAKLRGDSSKLVEKPHQPIKPIKSEIIINKIEPSNELKSQARYEKQYEYFTTWCTENNVTSITEEVLVNYFTKLSETKKATTMWPYYSMLRSCIYDKNSIDISTFTKLRSFLKRRSANYKPKQFNVLEIDQINKFISEADDFMYLAMKVVLILGYSGGCRRDEMTAITLDDIDFKNDCIKVTIPTRNHDKLRVFVITKQSWIDIIKNYLQLRPPYTPHHRFLLGYNKGKCYISPTGVHKIGETPRIVAKFLKLPNPELYSTHSFRKTLSSHLANLGTD